MLLSKKQDWLCNHVVYNVNILELLWRNIQASLSPWLAGVMGRQGSGPDAYPKGCRLTVPVFPQAPESCQRQKAALLFYKEVGFFQP